MKVLQENREKTDNSNKQKTTAKTTAPITSSC